MAAFLLALWLLAKPAVELKVYNPVGPPPIRILYRTDPARVSYADTVIVCDDMVVAGSRHSIEDGASWRVDWPLTEYCDYDAQITGFDRNGKEVSFAHQEIDLKGPSY